MKGPEYTKNYFYTCSQCDYIGIGNRTDGYLMVIVVH